MSSALQVQKLAFALCVPPQAINDNTAYTSTIIDTINCKAVHCLVHFGAMDIAVAALKVQESDVAASTTALTNGTDIPLADFSVSPATLPTATDDNHFFLVTIPVTGSRKRYFDLSFTAGDGAAGTYGVAIWIKESQDELPNTAAKRGLTQHLIVAG